jgi:Rad3-related DNA helicase
MHTRAPDEVHIPQIFINLDGTGRKPRPSQIRFLNWVYDSNSRIKVSILPVALGKSFIAKTLQKSIKATVITCNNVLVDQYESGYPADNILKGKAHYACHSYPGSSCETSLELYSRCENCPYLANRSRALAGESTIFNPMSLYALLNSKKGYEGIRPSLTIVDEAHQLASMLRLLSSAHFSSADYALPKDVTDYLKVKQWLTRTHASIKKLIKLIPLDAGKQGNIKRDRLKDEDTKFKHALHGFVEDQSNYAVYLETKGAHKVLTIVPVKVVRSVANKILGTGHIMLMSGTLFKTDIEELVGAGKYEIYEATSPIPLKNRPVDYRPAPFRMNYETDPKKIAALIEATIAETPNVNTIVHVSYALSRRLQPHMTLPFISNTAEDKIAKLALFKKDGGIFLASGCGEGIDLADDTCRLNIIPQLLFPNLGDPVVIKRKAQEDGQLWYALETMKTVIQQYGRSTRHEKDWSRTVILDPNFGMLVARYGKELPKYFTSAIIWPKKKG